jgi:hypothetical protein
MKNYIIQDREAGNEIESFSTIQEAQKTLLQYEQTDKREGNYTPGFYEIKTATFSNLKSFYIEFLNKKKGYSKDVAYFETYDKAISWGREFLENFNSDMIKISL